MRTEEIETYTWSWSIHANTNFEDMQRWPDLRCTKWSPWWTQEKTASIREKCCCRSQETEAKKTEKTPKDNKSCPRIQIKRSALQRASRPVTNESNEETASDDTMAEANEVATVDDDKEEKNNETEKKMNLALHYLIHR